jgi:hypothetical protein
MRRRLEKEQEAYASHADTDGAADDDGDYAAYPQLPVDEDQDSMAQKLNKLPTPPPDYPPRTVDSGTDIKKSYLSAGADEDEDDDADERRRLGGGGGGGERGGGGGGGLLRRGDGGGGGGRRDEYDPEIDSDVGR